MLALFLGLVALTIAILYSSAYDKIANEIRDIRIKCMKIENNYSKQTKNDEINNKDDSNIDEELDEEELDEELDNDDEDPNYEWEIPELTQNRDYYDNSVFKETFSNEDIIEEFI
tara:strand:- start:2578 stop:2922 length:345 start_codon:yes stop_codon:yes gene_type:complete